MKVDLTFEGQSKEILAALERGIEKRLPSSTSFRIHPGSNFGVNEITRGLARLFPHRRSIAYFKGCGPYLDPLMKHFSAEGFAVQALPFESMNQTDWVENLKKDTLFVLFSRDDPLTGQIFPFEKFDSILGTKKIFSVSTSHSMHLTAPDWSVGPYQAVVMSAGSGYSVSLLGDRCSRVEPLLYGPSNWLVGAREAIEPCLELRNWAPEPILEFESRAWAGAKPFFSEDSLRVYDRAAIYWTDMDGEALIHHLGLKLKESIALPGADNRLETASLCRWKGSLSVKWLEEQGVSSEVIRGLVLISRELLTPQLGPTLEGVRSQILELQGSL